MANEMVKKISRFFSNLKSNPIEIILFLCASFSIVILFLMIVFVAREGIVAFYLFGRDLILGQKWNINRDLFGGLPLIYGSIMVTTGAMLISIPIGVCSAIFISEVVPFSLRDPIKLIIEFLASIPSVIYGFIGIIALVPFIESFFGLPSGKSALTASLILAVMTIPTIVSVSGESISAVPKEYKKAALAVGSTKWQTIKNVVLPTSKSGILASIMRGFGRAIGETIAVSMVSGNQAHIPTPPWNYLEAVYTIPSFIAIHMGEAAVGSNEYSALFGLALILLVITFSINTLADLIGKKGGNPS